MCLLSVYLRERLQTIFGEDNIIVTLGGGGRDVITARASSSTPWLNIACKLPCLGGGQYLTSQ